MSDLIIAGLALALQPVCREHIRQAEAAGLSVLLPKDGGARTDADQIALYGKGRDFTDGQWRVIDRRNVVTWALPEEAPHCHRGAYDLWLLDNGKLATMAPPFTPAQIAEQLKSWGELVRIGAELGLQPGAHWLRIKDWPHFEVANDGWTALPRVG